MLLQRYVESGQPHILNTTRPVVALHKDRSMFPLSLFVARLSGVGSDTLFIGVMRYEPTAGTSEDQVVKVGVKFTDAVCMMLLHPMTHVGIPAREDASWCWQGSIGGFLASPGARMLTQMSADGRHLLQFWATSGGMILCADGRMTDALGIQPGELVGRPFSNLCTDVEGVNKYLTTASQAIEGAVTDGQPTAVPTFRTKVRAAACILSSRLQMHASVAFSSIYQKQCCVLPRA